MMSQDPWGPLVSLLSPALEFDRPACPHRCLGSPAESPGMRWLWVMALVAPACTVPYNSTAGSTGDGDNGDRGMGDWGDWDGGWGDLGSLDTAGLGRLGALGLKTEGAGMEGIWDTEGTGQNDRVSRDRSVGTLEGLGTWGYRTWAWRDW